MLKNSTLRRTRSMVGGKRSFRVLLLFCKTMLLIGYVLCSVGYAQDTIDHGPTGTANHDYFDTDPGTRNLLGMVESYHWGKAQDQFRAGRYFWAKQELDYMLVRFPNHPKGLMLMGATARMMKNPLLARLYYEKALRLFPQYALTHAQYGLYLADIGDVKEGIAQLEKAVEMNPRLAQAHTWLAQVYAKSGNAERARQAAARARELQAGGGMPSKEESNLENSGQESHANPVKE